MMTSTNHFRAAAAATVAALLLVGCKAEVAEPPTMEYAVLRVDTTTVRVADRYPAAIQGRQDVELYPQVSGKIVAVNVAEGQRVAAGQTLFVIDQVPYRAALATAEANLSAARAAEATARLNAEGKRQLEAQGVTSHFDAERAANALLSAQAAVEQAEAQLLDARNNLSYTTVQSPSAGVVGTIPYRVGALVSPSSPSALTTVSDNAEMWVYFSLPESRLLALLRRHATAGEAVEAMPQLSLLLSDGTTYEHPGRVASISGVVDAATGSVQLRAVFPNPDGLLHSGGAGDVALMREHPGVVAIPQAATYELQDKVYAYRLVAGRAVATMLAVEAVDEQRIYIVRSGLAPGDTIVAEGVGLLQDGAPIMVKRPQ